MIGREIIPSTKEEYLWGVLERALRFDSDRCCIYINFT